MRCEIEYMKQVFQDVSNGQSRVIDVPRPRCKPGHLVVRSSLSLISAGTERMLVDFGRAGYIDKARQQPEKVRMVIDKVRTDGLLTTIEAVRAKLDQPLPMGYSNVGGVIEVGDRVNGFAVGDRVVSNGHHAELVCVPTNLCARIPDDVRDADAVFAVVGAIALQGIRLAEPTIGECFVVTGLGLIGLMTVQLLRAHGCRVLGIDMDADKLAVAAEYGAITCNLAEKQDPIEMAHRFSRGRGIDGVIIAAATKSNEPIHQAAKMCRKRGRIILVGVTGLEIERADFYDKEIRFQVSCSYGPGRYDPAYEEQGLDYPVGFVRWTEQRNFEAVLDLFATGRLDASRLRTAFFDIDDAALAYDKLVTDQSTLGIVLRYSNDSQQSTANEQPLKIDKAPRVKHAVGKAVIGAIGAGNYAGRILLPAFRQTGARLKSIASSQGVTGTLVGSKLGFETSTTDAASILNDDSIDTVVIATRHDSHARYVTAALERGKNVFVEKPLALGYEEIDMIDAAYQAAHDRGENTLLMVGFNRRFAPLTKKLRAELDKSKSPISLIYTCNAGFLPADTWIQDSRQGGGRIIGEACHFVDMARYLAGAPIRKITSDFMNDVHTTIDCHDTASITILFENGSLASILYFANGHSSFPKERIEVFQAGRTYQLNNFRTLKCFGSNGVTSRSLRQDKGQRECCSRFVQAIMAGVEAPIPYDQLIEVGRASIAAATAAKNSP